MIDIDKLLPTARAALDTLVRIPSVSADPTEDLRRSAELTATLFRDAGMPDVEILDDIPWSTRGAGQVSGATRPAGRAAVRTP